jgi:hypothetical protein
MMRTSPVAATVRQGLWRDPRRDETEATERSLTHRAVAILALVGDCALSNGAFNFFG